MANSIASRPRVAVVTGGHSYDVPRFHELWRAMPEYEVDLQHLEDFASSPEPVRDSYAVVVFYLMMMEGPKDEGLPWYAGKPQTALAHLGSTPQGIIVLHHALLAYPQWSTWNDLTGLPDRRFGYHFDQTVDVRIADAAHPITTGLAAWTMPDETYTMADASPADGNHVLLTVDHPKSLRTLAWTRQYRQARVLCFQSGHDHRTWADANFREVLRRGVRWAAGRD